jgi:hypothetical protein
MIRDVTLRILTMAVYSLPGAAYLVLGVGSIALPAGWISPRWAGDDAADLYRAAAPDGYLNHLTQEFGTLTIAVGLVFLWQARRGEPSGGLHWLLTLYLVLDSSIHWIGPQGFIGSLQRGLINSIPAVALRILGFLWWGRADSWQPPQSAVGKRQMERSATIPAWFTRTTGWRSIPNGWMFTSPGCKRRSRRRFAGSTVSASRCSSWIADHLARATLRSANAPPAH